MGKSNLKIYAGAETKKVLNASRLVDPIDSFLECCTKTYMPFDKNHSELSKIDPDKPTLEEPVFQWIKYILKNDNLLCLM